MKRSSTPEAQVSLTPCFSGVCKAAQNALTVLTVFSPAMFRPSALIKSALVAFLSAFALSVSLGAESSATEDPLDKLLGDPVVAKAKSFEIKNSQLRAEVIRTKQLLALQQQQANFDLDRSVLEKMINLKVLLAEANDADRAKAKEIFDRQWSAFKKDRKLSDTEFDSMLDTDLKVKGITRAEWERQQQEQLTIVAVVQRLLNAPFTEEQAKKYYEDNVPKFEEPEMVHALHILLSTHDPLDPNPNVLQRRELSEAQKKAKRQIAEDIVKRARAGEDFKKLVQEYSDDPNAKQNNGEIILIRDSRTAPEEFKAAAFALKNTNEVSDVVTSVVGYHVIKLLDRTPARKEPYAGLDTKTIIPKIDGTKYTIRDALLDEVIQKESPALLKRLKQEQAVEIPDPKLRLDDSSSPTATASGLK
jgi:peptidyl-prolyl cis-trans isomerase C